MADRGKERLPYRLTPVLEMLRDIARKGDLKLEAAIVRLSVALAEGDAVNITEAHKVLLDLTEVFRGNADALNILSLINESTLEATLIEVDRIDAKYQETTIKPKRRGA